MTFGVILGFWFWSSLISVEYPAACFGGILQSAGNAFNHETFYYFLVF
jgi:hypothetical protein